MKFISPLTSSIAGCHCAKQLRCETMSKSIVFIHARNRYYGGFTNLLDKAGMKEWMPTVIGNPWLFRGNLIPISDLILDDMKKKEMKVAVQVHLDKAYLTVGFFLFCFILF